VTGAATARSVPGTGLASVAHQKSSDSIKGQEATGPLFAGEKQ